MPESAAGLATRPLLYAHRGAGAESPENTLPSFARGLERGAHALETDVHLTADGAVVLSHDETARRMCGVPTRLADATLDEVQRWDAGWGFLDRAGRRPYAGRGIRVPTLEQLLVEFPGVPLNVDIKPASAAVARAVVDVLRAQRATDRVRLASFHRATLRAVRLYGYEGPTSLSRDEAAAVALAPTPLARWLLGRRSLAGVDAAQLPSKLGPLSFGSAPVLARCHALGLRVDYWTVNDPREAEALLAAGADGIMTDDPAAIAPVFARLAAMA